MTAARTPQAPARPCQTPRLRPAKLDDYPAIARLKASNGLGSMPARDWESLCADNPLRHRLGGWPLGWVLEESTGRLVGSLANVPSLYVYKGSELVAANGHAWVVDPEYRGVALWLMDEYFGQAGVDLFVNTTVNARAEAPFGAFGSTRVPVGDWQTAAYRVSGYVGFAAAALRSKHVRFPRLLAYPAAAALRLVDAICAPTPPGPCARADVDEVDGFDARFDGFWTELVRLNPDRLIGVRDREALAWHFAGPHRDGRLWVFTASTRGTLRAYLVLKRQDAARTGLRRVRVVDFQAVEPEPEALLAGLLRAALGRCEAEGVHTLEHVGVGLPDMPGLDRVAPRRRSLPSWPFYYKAADPALAAELRDPGRWAPTAFDGDASMQ